MNTKTELKEKIESAAVKIEIINPENIEEIESYDLKEEMEEYDELSRAVKNIADELIENDIKFYSSPIAGYKELETFESLEKYTEWLSDWAEAEYDTIYSLSISDPDQYGKIFLKIAQELFDYKEDGYGVSVLEKGEDAWRTVSITIYDFNFNEDQTLNIGDVNILQFDGLRGEEYYVGIDDEDRKELVDELNYAPHDDSGLSEKEIGLKMIKRALDKIMIYDAFSNIEDLELIKNAEDITI